MNRRGYITVLVLVFVGLVGVAYLTGMAPFVVQDLKVINDRNNQVTKVGLRLKWITTAGFAGDYYAKALGLFNSAGLELEIRPGGPLANPLLLVPAGSDDFGVIGADGFLLARSNGAPIVAIAAAFQRNAAGFFTKQDSGIHGPRDWVGRKVGVMPGNDTETIYRALISKLQLDRTKITEVPIGFELTQFLSGQIDVQPGYITNQPNLLKAKKIDVAIVDPSAYGVSLLGNVYFTTEATLREKPMIVRRFLEAALRGWQRAIENPKGAVDALLKADPKLDQTTQLSILNDTIPLLFGQTASWGGWIRVHGNKRRKHYFKLGY